MNGRIGFSVLSVTACVAFLSGGCAAFRGSVETVDVNKSAPMSAKYDYSDLRTMTDEVADKLLEHPFMQKQKDAPLVAVFDIENRTTIHVDTQAMTDTLRRKLMDTGKMRFVQTARRDQLLKEQKYQGEHATQDTKVAVGKQLGAKYMITGSFVEITKKSPRQVRVSAKEEIYYQLTVDVTDIETSELVASPQIERARKESKPLIGW